MALIEGVGDEVTLLFASLLLLLVLLLAWISTRTSEPPEHLFTSTSGPASSLRSPAQQDTPPSSTNTSSSSSSGSVSDSSLTEGPPTNTSTQDKEVGRGGGEGGGDGVRSRGRGGGGGEGGGGAEPSSSQRNMVVRLKFLNDTERTAQVQPQDTIGYIKRSVHTVHHRVHHRVHTVHHRVHTVHHRVLYTEYYMGQTRFCVLLSFRTYFAGQEQQVRLIYQGQLLQDDTQTLASLNLVHNCVLHCHISQHAGRGAATGPRPADQVQVALNVGSLMVPLLVLMLSVLWYCQIQYRQFFTAPATASLVGVTIFLSLVAFGVYRR
ncbi:Transmembrane and ubiquitin-like domain-containing protein 1 [Collichthys lucidus]|uniref:Transmembrane and ubiquitin-like domain-containing protein 1 n=1 Tax=Collichthys lucidus TaxID=240159 RepID=A0A4U5UVH2_COLLU|nr:Transmembrane and ubiquitin-like domain-containing protein 1 [Collichthys lucidus]